MPTGGWASVPRQAIKPRLAAFVAGLTLVMGTFVVAEGFLRLFGPRESYSRYDPHTRWSLRPGYRGPGPNLPDVPLTYDVRINEAGFRGGPVDRNKPIGVVRLAGLGDSVTFGFGVREEETFLASAATALSSDIAPARVEWINAGVPGFTSFQGLRHLERRVLPFAPDIVTILYGWNDGWRTNVSDAAWTGRNVDAAIEFSRVLTLARSGANTTLRRLGAPDLRGTFPRVPIVEFETNLLRISDEVRRAGAIPILITPPAAFGADRPPDAYFRHGWTVPRSELEPMRLRYAEAVRRVAAAASIPLVDCAHLVPSDPTLFLIDGYHPNAAGYQLMAEKIVTVVREGRLLRR